MKFTLLFSIYFRKMFIIKLSGICGLNAVMALECRLIQFWEIHLSVNGSKVIKLNAVNEVNEQSNVNMNVNVFEPENWRNRIRRSDFLDCCCFFLHFRKV